MGQSAGITGVKGIEPRQRFVTESEWQTILEAADSPFNNSDWIRDLRRRADRLACLRIDYRRFCPGAP